MGMYDEVQWRCQECGKLQLEQSKAGDCSLKVYSLYNIRGIPLSILEDMQNEGLYCEGCGASHTLELDYVIQGTLVLDEEG